jgi:cell pole-organizing protein PopZ
MGEERSIPGGPHGSVASSALTLRADSGPHAAHDLAEAGSGGLPVARTIEDTVAELLRPMLKNWLAENMPKIVERALRKELDDSSRSEHKPAAE